MHITDDGDILYTPQWPIEGLRYIQRRGMMILQARIARANVAGVRYDVDKSVWVDVPLEEAPDVEPSA